MTSMGIGPDEWSLPRLTELVAQHELERGRIEYKRQLDNGHKTLEAIAALANTFGGVVLVGVDETQQGPARLVGVEAHTRERLVNLCWNQLSPPYDPEIIPIKIEKTERYVLVIVVDPARARRPVMLNQGNKVLVRLEGANVAPDWYRLRELFQEQPPAPSGRLLSAANVNTYSGPGQLARAIAVRGRLALAGPNRHRLRIAEKVRTSTLEILRDQDCPLTGAESALSDVLARWCGDPVADLRGWHLNGRSSTLMVNAGWQALLHGTDQCAAEAHLLITSVPPHAPEGGLMVQLDAVISDPDGLDLPGAVNRRFLDLGTLAQLMLNILGMLWGPLGARLSLNVLDQPLGPPAELDLAVFTIEANRPSQIALSDYLDFGAAELIPGNTPGPWMSWEPVLPDLDLLDQQEQRKLVRRSLIELGIDNGYQDVEREVDRHPIIGPSDASTLGTNDAVHG